MKITLVKVITVGQQKIRKEITVEVDDSQETNMDQLGQCLARIFPDGKWTYDPFTKYSDKE